MGPPPLTLFRLEARAYSVWVIALDIHAHDARTKNTKSMIETADTKF